jgi:hypothetical protein
LRAAILLQKRLLPPPSIEKVMAFNTVLEKFVLLNKQNKSLLFDLDVYH